MSAATPAAPASPPPALAPDATAGFSDPPRKANGEVDWPALYIAFFAMVLGQFMALLDIQIVASSLPQIQAGVGASVDEISWVQTAYLIPEVVMIPLSAYLSRLWGTQKLFMLSSGGFLVMSVLTGLSTNIDMMIVTRGLQGFIGGAMIPTVFAMIFTAFPLERRITANTIMGLVVTLAPTFGPTVGGHLTELLSWRWLFFINIVPGAVSLILMARYGKFDRGDPALAEGFDWIGLFSMAVFLGSMAYVLEEGAKDNWFDDSGILWLTVLSAVCGVMFVWRQFAYWQPIVQVRALLDRNFAVGVLINFANGATIFGGTFLMPLFLGRVEHYSSAQVGTTMIVSGMTMAFLSPVVGRFVRRVEPRACIFIGLLIASSGIWTAHGITANWGFWQFALMQALRSCGAFLAMVGSQMLAMNTLAPSLVKSASSILNLARNTGGAVGLAVASSQLTVNTAQHLNDLTSAVSVSSVQAQAMLAGLTQRMAQMGAADPAGAARKAFDGLLLQQAQVLAFGDGFALVTAGCAAAAFIGLIAKPGPLQVWGRAAPAAKAPAPQTLSEAH